MNRKRNLLQLDLYENNIFHFYTSPTVALFAGHAAHESVSKFYSEFFLLLNMLTENFQISKFHHYYLFKVLKNIQYMLHIIMSAKVKSRKKYTNLSLSG